MDTLQNNLSMDTLQNTLQNLISITNTSMNTSTDTLKNTLSILDVLLDNLRQHEINVKWIEQDYTNILTYKCMVLGWDILVVLFYDLYMDDSLKLKLLKLLADYCNKHPTNQRKKDTRKMVIHYSVEVNKLRT
jgi:hypothetical protein